MCLAINPAMGALCRMIISLGLTPPCPNHSEYYAHILLPSSSTGGHTLISLSLLSVARDSGWLATSSSASGIPLPGVIWPTATNQPIFWLRGILRWLAIQSPTFAIGNIRSIGFILLKSLSRLCFLWWKLFPSAARSFLIPSADRARRSLRPSNWDGILLGLTSPPTTPPLPPAVSTLTPKGELPPNFHCQFVAK